MVSKVSEKIAIELKTKKRRRKKRCFLSLHIN